MAKSKTLFLQFYRGEMARLEQWGVTDAIGDITTIDFKPAQNSETYAVDLNLYTHIILGAANYDYPEQLPAGTREWVDRIIQLHFPILGIDFGNLIIADLFGMEIKRNSDLASIDSVKTVQIRNNRAELLTGIKVNNFNIYLNHIDSIVDGDITKTFLSSEANPFMGIDYSQRIKGLMFVPYLNKAMYRYWLKPFPDLWLNILGFWSFSRIRKIRTFRKLAEWYRYRFHLKPDERRQDDELLLRIANEPVDFASANKLMRNFILLINK